METAFLSEVQLWWGVGGGGSAIIIIVVARHTSI